MPNVRISDLPLATLPLVGADSFFEVQTIEGGEQVSRKVAADEITISSGNIVGTGIAPPAGGLPYDYDALLTFENANAQATATLGWDGASTLKLENLAFGASLQLTTRSTGGATQVAFVHSASNDVTQIGQDAIHIDGNGDIDFEYDVLGGNTGNLMILRQFDLQLIDQATSTSGRLVFSQGSFIITERGHIGLDSDGVFRMHAQVGGGPAIRARTSGTDWDVLDVDTPQGELRLYQIAAAVRTLSLSTQPTGIRVHGDGTNDPVTPGLTQNASVQLRNASDEITGFVGYATTDFLLTANQRGAELIFRATDDAGIQPILFQADPNDNTQLGHGASNAFVARTITPAAGGLEVNNTLTGAGFERVLTTADIGGGVSFPVDAADNDQIRWGTGQDMLQFFDGTDMQFNAVDGVDFRFVGGTAGAENMLVLTSNGAVEIYDNGVLVAQSTQQGMDLFASGAANAVLQVEGSGGGDAGINLNEQGVGTQLQIKWDQGLQEASFRLSLPGDNFRFFELSTGDVLLEMTQGAGVDAYFDGVQKTATVFEGLDVFGTRLDLINSLATAADIAARNTEGGILLRADGDTFSLFQTDAAGATEDLIIDHSNNDSLRFYFNGLLRATIASNGLNVDVTSGGTNGVIDMHAGGAGNDASFRARADNGGYQLIWDETNTVVLMRQINGVGSVEDTWIAMEQNGEVELFNNGAGVARTITAANGGLEANNANTGGGYERVLTTSDIGGSGGLITTAFKTTSETITNDNTLSDDADLVVAVVANQRYSLEVFFDFSSANAADFQFDLRGPAGFNLDGLVVMGIEDTILQLTSASSLTIDTTNPAFVYHASIIGKVFATSSGDVRFRWAQGISDAGNTTLLIGSWIRIQRLS